MPSSPTTRSSPFPESAPCPTSAPGSAPPGRTSTSSAPTAAPATAWERLSYPDAAVSYGTAADLARKDFDSLAVMLVANPAPVRTGVAVPGISDDDFLRGDAPMTKEEVRTLALSKLHLYSHHIL